MLNLERPDCTGEHAGCRSNLASWTGSLRAFIFSQEGELRPRPLHPFPARGELASREGSGPGIRRECHLVSLVPQRPVCTGEHVGCRSNIASWTVSLQAFIFSQEAELRPRPLFTFLTSRELASRERALNPGPGENAILHPRSLRD